jgi:TonB family protein
VLVSSRSLLACVAFLSLLATRGSAQRVTCPRSDSLVARPCELDQPLAEIEPGQRRPSYPDILRQAGVSGEVLLRYVVDTNGRALPATVEVLRSSHALFATAVKNSMPRQRFAPPRRAGVLTSVLVEELVTFTYPGWISVRQQQFTSRTADSTGRLLTTIYTFMPRDSAKAPVLTVADTAAIMEAVIDELTARISEKESPAAWCVSLDSLAPSADMLERWRQRGRRVVAVSECPQTYARMILTPYNPKPPPGWVDPVYIAATNLLSWAENTVIVTIRTRQGTGSRTKRCEVVRDAGNWKAYCFTTEMSVS